MLTLSGGLFVHRNAKQNPVAQVNAKRSSKDHQKRKQDFDKKPCLKTKIDGVMCDPRHPPPTWDFDDFNEQKDFDD